MLKLKHFAPIPTEIMEQILKYADGRTLLRASYVCRHWRGVVHKLTLQTDIWRRCCEEDIAPDKIRQILRKYCGIYPETDNEMWRAMYYNLFKWQRIELTEAPSQISVLLPDARLCIVSGRVLGAIARENGVDEVMFLNLQDDLRLSWPTPSGLPETEITWKCWIPLQDSMLNKCFMYLEENGCLMLVYNGHILKRILDSVLFVKVYEKVGYILTSDNSVFTCDLKYPQTQAAPLFQLKWQPTEKIIAMNDMAEGIMLLTKTGRVLKANPQRDRVFTETIKLVMSTELVSIHLEYEGIIIGILEDGELYICIGDTIDLTATYDCKHILGSEGTALKVHCDILFLGLANGDMFAYNIKSVDQLLGMDLLKYVTKWSLEKSPVTRIDVAELDDSQRVISNLANGKVYQSVFRISEASILQGLI